MLDVHIQNICETQFESSLLTASLVSRLSRAWNGHNLPAPDKTSARESGDEAAYSLLLIDSTPSLYTTNSNICLMTN